MDSDDGSPSNSSSGSTASVPLEVLPLHSTNLLTVLDEHGVIQYESPSIEHVFGYQQEELVGKQVAEYFHPDDREDVIAAVESVVTSEEYTVEAVEYRHRRADGAYTWVESVASANPTPDGNYVVNTRDISARIERERELEHSNERLEEFAGIVSHDLRNPLNVAQGRLRLAQEDCESDHLTDVANAHERMETLIENLLTLARVGNQVSETESVELAQLTDTCWQTVATGDATLRIETERQLRADRARLQQLLENLIHNAIEHGGEDVTLMVGTTETGFYVEDDGPGIPKGERDDVFETGYSTAHDGTGLGLSIVQQIAESHGWELDLTEGQMGGARFEITDVEFEPQ